MTDEPETPKPAHLPPVQAQAKINKIGFDNLLEDLFGLNIRGLRTIKTLFLKPAEYFRAARHPSWENEYTPSFRLWFAIIAIGTALRFFWASPDSATLLAYEEMLKNIVEQANLTLKENGKMIDPEKVDITNAANLLIKYTQVLTPFAYFIFFILLAGIYRAWGIPTGFVERLRYVFAIIVPGSLIGFIAVALMINIPIEIFHYVNSAAIVFMILSYFLVAYFGAYAHMKDGSRFPRSIVVTIFIVLTVTLATILTVGISLILTVKETFPAAIPIPDLAVIPPT